MLLWNSSSGYRLTSFQTQTFKQLKICALAAGRGMTDNSQWWLLATNSYATKDNHLLKKSPRLSQDKRCSSNSNGQMMMRWCCGDGELMMRWCQGDAEGMLRRCRGDDEVMSRWCRGDAEVMLRWCWGDIEVMLRWYWGDAEMTLRRRWGDIEVMLRFSLDIYWDAKWSIFAASELIWPLADGLSSEEEIDNTPCSVTRGRASVMVLLRIDGNSSIECTWGFCLVVIFLY